MSETIKIKECMHCKDGKTACVYGPKYNGLGEPEAYGYQVVCDCGARGPLRAQALDAVVAWNRHLRDERPHPPCPFCRSRSLEMLRDWASQKTRVGCTSCGAMGPAGKDDDEAQGLWAGRAR